MDNPHINRSDPSNLAQTSIDFLIGMTLFAGVFFFVFQFTSAAVAPFVFTSEELPTKTQKVTDNLYFNELTEGDRGELDMSYLESNDIDAVKGDLGVTEERYGMNITATRIGGDDPDVSVGNRPPDSGASVSRTVRFGTASVGTAEFDKGDKVLLRVRVW